MRMLLAGFDDVAEHLAAMSLAAAPGAGVGTAVNDDPHRELSHSGYGLIGEQEHRRVAGPTSYAGRQASSHRFRRIECECQTATGHPSPW